MLADFFTRVISSEMEHFTARKSRQNNKLGPNFDSNKIEQGLAFRSEKTTCRLWLLLFVCLFNIRQYSRSAAVTLCVIASRQTSQSIGAIRISAMFQQ